MIPGTYPALPTPFDHGKVDYQALRRQIRYVLDNGCEGVLACGTTGEAPTLTADEWKRVVETTVDEAGGRPVIVGTGTNNTVAAVDRTILAREIGATAALVVVPYYNKPMQEGLFRHFKAVAEGGQLPIVLYNVPGRSGRNMEPTTIARLSHLEHIEAVKEASGDLDAVSQILKTSKPGFQVFSGDDLLSLPMYSLGAHGVITTTGNVAPKIMSRMYRSFEEMEIQTARLDHFSLLPLFQALFAEVNPAPVKFALSELGLMRNELRLPMIPVSVDTQDCIRGAMKAVHLL